MRSLTAKRSSLIGFMAQSSMGLFCAFYAVAGKVSVDSATFPDNRRGSSKSRVRRRLSARHKLHQLANFAYILTASGLGLPGRRWASRTTSVPFCFLGKHFQSHPVLVPCSITVKLSFQHIHRTVGLFGAQHRKPQRPRR